MRRQVRALAVEFGFEDCAQPAGGCCFPSDGNHSLTRRDLWVSRAGHAYQLDDSMLLKVGRHRRPAPHPRLHVGREQAESKWLNDYRRQYPGLQTFSHRGRP